MCWFYIDQCWCPSYGVPFLLLFVVAMGGSGDDEENGLRELIRNTPPGSLRVVDQQNLQISTAWVEHIKCESNWMIYLKAFLSVVDPGRPQFSDCRSHLWEARPWAEGLKNGTSFQPRFDLRIDGVHPKPLLPSTQSFDPSSCNGFWLEVRPLPDRQQRCGREHLGYCNFVSSEDEAMGTLVSIFQTNLDWPLSPTKHSMKG